MPHTKPKICSMKIIHLPKGWILVPFWNSELNAPSSRQMEKQVKSSQRWQNRLIRKHESTSVLLALVSPETEKSGTGLLHARPEFSSLAEIVVDVSQWR